MRQSRCIIMLSVLSVGLVPSACDTAGTAPPGTSRTAERSSERQQSTFHPLVLARTPQRVTHAPPYHAQDLGTIAANPFFTRHVERAIARWRAVHRRTDEPPSLFEKVVAAADYVANLAKHPHRHWMKVNHTDERAWELTGDVEALTRLAAEHQRWSGSEWIAAEGDTLRFDVAPLECTFQHLILGALVNRLGAQWMLVEIEAHTAFAYYDFELGQWVYIESTYNEHYRRAGTDPDDYTPLSPSELYELARAGRAREAIPVRHPYQPQRMDHPAWHLPPYSEHHPDGWRSMAVNLAGASIGPCPPHGVRLMRVLPGAGETYFANLIHQGWVVDDDPDALWAPQGETFLDSVVDHRRYQVRVKLSTNLAVPEPWFERRINSGAWQQCEEHDVVPVLRGDTVRYRATDGTFVSGQIVLTRQTLSAPSDYGNAPPAVSSP